MYDGGVNQSGSMSTVSTVGALGSALTDMLLAQEIVPGSDPGYQLCKTIYSYHPLGALLAEAPIKRAQSKKRKISVAAALGQEHIIAQFEKTWEELARLGGDVILRDLIGTSRIYGISCLGVGSRGEGTDKPLDPKKIAAADLYFNILDPLNTAGSLVLNQDPNSPDFLKPSNQVLVSGQEWHHSRLFVKMNESPLFIEWSSSAFGFVGRSVYQRALYPLKTFVQTMLTDQMVTQKCGLLVAKMKSPGAIIDEIMKKMFGSKRGKLREGMTGQVLSIGIEEAIETLNMQNLEGPFKIAREDVLKNIATACGMPFSIIAQEAMVEGFGEGTEDSKKEASYIEYIQKDAKPAYDFLDRIVMRKAWTKEFYETMQFLYKEYRKKSYETAVYEWIASFSSEWPNPLTEPDSEKVKTEDVQMKSVVALLEVLLPESDPKTRAKLVSWAADNVNAREMLFSGQLDIDEEEIAEYFKTKEAKEQEATEEEPHQPRPFAAAS